VERTLAFGLALQTNVQLKTMLEQVNENYPSILSLQIVDTIGNAGTILWESGPPLADPMTFVRVQRRSGKPMWFDTSLPDNFIQTWVINDPIGQSVANLTLSADKRQVTALLADAKAKLFKVWLMLCFAVLLILTPMLLYIFSRLDRIIAAAQAILQGKEIDANAWQRSEICDLATQIAKSGQTPQVNKR
jgi:hypothetical protein